MNRSDNFGFVLRTAREKARKSQEDVARYLKVSGTYVADVEHGKRAPLTRGNILKAAHFLDVSPAEMFLAAADWHGTFVLPVSTSSAKNALAARLAAKWETLDPNVLQRISSEVGL